MVQVLLWHLVLGRQNHTFSTCGLKLAPVRLVKIHTTDRPQSRSTRTRDSDLSPCEGTSTGVTAIP